MSCRIRNALEKCHCVPYFYNINSKKFPICNVSGMICLTEHESWTNISSISPCYCPDMCETILITNLERKVATDNFDTKVEYLIVLPRTVIKRGILFDYIDMIVGLGGSLALFLGFSFLSGVEIIFFMLEFVLDIFIEVTRLFEKNKIIREKIIILK